jgi:alkanesulfonate monooxygenase SsuD/methylene tetrahydromethanopterin reductase-like flavin-dependent oxidoreductase (luciferase family)
MAGVNVVAAATDDEARRLFTTVQQSFTNLVRGAGGKLQPPIDDIEDYWTAAEKHHASHMLKYSIAGSPETVRRELESFAELTRADELMIVTSIYDHHARVRSYEIVAEVVGASNSTNGVVSK